MGFPSCIFVRPAENAEFFCGIVFLSTSLIPVVCIFLFIYSKPCQNGRCSFSWKGLTDWNAGRATAQTSSNTKFSTALHFLTELYEAKNWSETGSGRPLPVLLSYFCPPVNLPEAYRPLFCSAVSSHYSYLHLFSLFK